MRSLALAALLLLTAVSASGQVSINLKTDLTQQDNEALRARLPELRQAAQRFELRKRIDDAIGGLPITADRMDLDASGKVVHASGNVRLRTNELVITADDAVIENGQIQLGANARIVFDYPVKMIQ